MSGRRQRRHRARMRARRRISAAYALGASGASRYCRGVMSADAMSRRRLAARPRKLERTSPYRSPKGAPRAFCCATCDLPMPSEIDRRSIDHIEQMRELSARQIWLCSGLILTANILTFVKIDNDGGDTIMLTVADPRSHLARSDGRGVPRAARSTTRQSTALRSSIRTDGIR